MSVLSDVSFLGVCCLFGRSALRDREDSDAASPVPVICR